MNQNYRIHHFLLQLIALLRHKVLNGFKNVSDMQHDLVEGDLE